MKPTLCGLILVALLINPSQDFGSSDQEQNVECSPSSFLFSHDRQKSAVATVVTLQREDLRRIYCDAETLHRREIGNLIVLDKRGRSSEASVNAKETIESFLNANDMNNLWKTSWQPQVRLVTMDAIYQSPARFDRTALAAFMRKVVRPGDIVVITLTD